jgi:hypothetical protein
MKLTWENRSTRGKTCPSATLSTTKPTWTDPGPNPGLRGDRPTTNRLSHGTVLCRCNAHLLTIHHSVLRRGVIFGDFYQEKKSLIW